MYNEYSTGGSAQMMGMEIPSSTQGSVQHSVEEPRVDYAEENDLV